MTSPVYRVTKLTPGFDLRAFDCGEPAYNEWLVQHAANAVQAGSSRVYLLLQQVNPGAEERVVGYYAICPTMVVRDDMPKSTQRGALRAAPAWMLAKLALHRDGREKPRPPDQWSPIGFRFSASLFVDAQLEVSTRQSASAAIGTHSHAAEREP